MIVSGCVRVCDSAVFDNTVDVCARAQNFRATACDHRFMQHRKHESEAQDASGREPVSDKRRGRRGRGRGRSAVASSRSSSSRSRCSCCSRSARGQSPVEHVHHRLLQWQAGEGRREEQSRHRDEGRRNRDTRQGQQPRSTVGRRDRLGDRQRHGSGGQPLCRPLRNARHCQLDERYSGLRDRLRPPPATRSSSPLSRSTSSRRARIRTPSRPGDRIVWRRIHVVGHEGRNDVQRAGIRLGSVPVGTGDSGGCSAQDCRAWGNFAYATASVNGYLLPNSYCPTFAAVER